MKIININTKYQNWLENTPINLKFVPIKIVSVFRVLFMGMTSIKNLGQTG